MKLLQINTTVNSGSHGRIAEDIGRVLMLNGHESYIAYGRRNLSSSSEAIKIGSILDVRLHVLKSHFFDLHGFGSTAATKTFIEEVKKIDPDIIHLHNIHGYYINFEVLFNYLKQAGKPVVWTLHDCWPFTGHCSYFDAVNCYKWETECIRCPNLKAYPRSFFIDNSRNNFNKKKDLFNGISNLTIVTPSHWLANHVKRSFLKECPVKVIYNGIDTSVFSPVNNNGEGKIQSSCLGKYILGVASTWDRRKGLADLVKLREILPSKTNIVLVGLKSEQIPGLPERIIGLERTNNLEELAALYRGAEVFVNPTYVDNFPTTNIEALACGTPVITYNTGGSPEAIDENTGFVVKKGNIEGLYEEIERISNKGKKHYQAFCRKRAVRLFKKELLYQDYVKLYTQMLDR